MYTLTEIVTDMQNVPFHQELGERFSVIDREASPLEFEKAYNAIYHYPSMKEVFLEHEINKDIYCVVVSEGGKKMFFLSRKNFYYIVTENGKTFKNLTCK